MSDAIDIPIMIQDAPVAGTPLSAPFLAKLAKEVANVSYFKIETAQAASKLRELIELGGDAIVGPWDGEEAITLIADLDAGATGAMTGGGYPDGIRKIVDAYAAGDTEARRRALSAMAAADQLRKPPVRSRRVQGADEGRRRDPLRRGAPSVRADASGHARRAC